MNSKVLVRILLPLTLCAVVVSYYLSKSDTDPSSMVTPTFSLSRDLSQPKEEESSLHEYTTSQATPPVKRVTQAPPLSTQSTEERSLKEHNTSQAHYGALPPFPKNLPYPILLKRASSIQKALWTSQLYQFLKSLNRSISPHVNMVFGDSNHLEIMMNWIIAAHVRLNPPLHNIMVLSIDQPLCDFLTSKKVPVTCIAAPAESFLAHTKRKSYRQGIKIRLLVLRLINFWGYDVASYDSDAILLRNPQHLYDSYPDVQFFAGSTTHPSNLYNLWGFAICGGSVIVRSHHSTENLWKTIHHGSREYSEQGLWNHAMQTLGMSWNVTTGSSELCDVQTGWMSYGPLASIVFPQTMFCRSCCTAEHTNEYYLTHRYAQHLKIALKRQTLKEMNSWFLLKHWNDSVNSPLEGSSWLMSIYNT